jgi:hypothetical protein
MSNNIQNADFLDFLGNKNFPNILEEQNLSVQLHNLLLALHVVAIGFNTTGISEGGTTIGYSRLIAPVEEDFHRPKNDFFFYTTKNQLIEDSLHCSNSRLSFKHELFHFKTTRDFRNFCVSYYQKNAKTIPEKEFKDNNFKDLTFRFRLNKLKRNEVETKNKAYEQLFKDESAIKSALEAMYLDQHLKNENRNKNKFKI